MTILYAILLFGFLIFIHELGHFIFAKLSNVKVLKFSLGFGPKVIGKKIGDTEYLLSAFPLGGYVKMLGEDPAEELESSEKERSYKNQPVHRRASIVFAGPVFNFLTAVVIFFFISLIGIPTLLPFVGEITEGAPAEGLLLKGDRVIEINNKPIKHWHEMSEIIHKSPGKTVKMAVQRDSDVIHISVIPEKKIIKNIFGEDEEIGLIGIKSSGETEKVRQNLPNAVKNAFVKTWEISALTIVGIIKLIQRIIPAETIGGPILIFQVAEKQAEAGALNFFAFAALISINLAILNLLPIPVLDGGHLLFLAIEAIRRKPLSEKAIAIAHRIGIAFIISLMALAMYNDVFRLFNGTPIP